MGVCCGKVLTRMWHPGMKMQLWVYVLWFLQLFTVIIQLQHSEVVCTCEPTWYSCRFPAYRILIAAAKVQLGKNTFNNRGPSVGDCCWRKSTWTFGRCALFCPLVHCLYAHPFHFVSIVHPFLKTQLWVQSSHNTTSQVVSWMLSMISSRQG